MRHRMACPLSPFWCPIKGYAKWLRLGLESNEPSTLGQVLRNDLHLIDLLKAQNEKTPNTRTAGWSQRA